MGSHRIPAYRIDATCFKFFLEIGVELVGDFLAIFLGEVAIGKFEVSSNAGTRNLHTAALLRDRFGCCG
jgi:hypothetical protein